MSKTISLDTLKRQLIKRNENGETWAAMAREYGVSTAVLWRLANEGYNPKNKKTRAKLSLPELVKQTVYRDEHGRFRKAGDVQCTNATNAV